MDVRPADLDDLPVCAALPTSVISTHVWQLRLAYDPNAAHPGDTLGAELQATRLPRPVTVQPADPTPLPALWQAALDVLVAETGVGIAGYMVLSPHIDSTAAMIGRLVVAPSLRRHGVGGLLLRSAAQWGNAQGYTRLIGHCGTRNFPASSLFLRYGLRFAGYSEAWYPHNGVALFFHRPL